MLFTSNFLQFLQSKVLILPNDMAKKTHFFLLCISIVFISFISSRSHFTDLVKEKLENYATKYTPEKVYIHTDKPYYSLGDDIWFSAFLVDGITHERSKKSWVIHTELINENDSIVSKRKLFTNDVIASGDFKLEETWPSGNYLLRAYTNYMRNEDSLFFQKELKVFANNTNDSIPIREIENGIQDNSPKLIKPDISFYPEGGNLVNGVRSKLAVKIKNAVYKNANLSGIVFDNDRNEIIKFTTSEFGLGNIILTPETNKTYFALIEVNGSEYKYPLPQALPFGYAISVVNSKSHFIINATSNTPKGLQNSYLVIHQRGNLVFEKYESSPKSNNSIRFPKTDLKDGVAHITLFDTEGRPVCERLIFINNPNNHTDIEIQQSNLELGTREKTAITLNIKDRNGNALPSYLSMSIRDLSAFPHNSRAKNIKTWLLLNSDLRGEIEDPGYFFEDENDYKRQYLLDLIMLTNGWRRFKWQNLLYDTESKLNYPIENGLTISGSTKFLRAPYNGTAAETRLTFMGEQVSQEPVKISNTNGEFSFGPFIFFDSIPVIIESRLNNFKSKEPKDRNVLIMVHNNDNSPAIFRKKSNTRSFEDEKQLENFRKLSEYIKQINFEFDMQNQKLDEITIIAKRKSEKEKRTQDMNDRTDYGFATQRLDLETNPRNIGETAFDLLNELPNVRAFNDSISIRNSGTPRVLLDNMQIDPFFLTTIMASEVSFIDVLIGADAAMFSDASNGVIAVYSKTGSNVGSRNVKRKPGVIDFVAEGFYNVREFYTPDHLNGFKELTKADIRTTLHWEPLIKIGESGSEEISFFTSDSRSDYLIEVEGISKSGIPLYKTSILSVE